MPVATILLLILIAFDLIPVPVVAEPSNYIGVGTCASSNCHGNAAPVRGSHIQQNEFVTWFRRDKHSKAYSVLLNPLSKRIGYHLGIDSPEKEPLCLSCHSTYVEDATKQEKIPSESKYHLEDGVSCESCHGSAEKWLKAHVERKATHVRNIELGMTDLVRSKDRIDVCLNCHLGSNSSGSKIESKVTHRLIGAGHPRLSFEIDTFQSVMPKHWNIDADYVERKGDYDSVKTWILGQVIQAVRRLNLMTSEKHSFIGFSGKGPFPELSNFACYSCHHSLSDKQFEKRNYEGFPGVLRLSLPEVDVLSAVLPILDKGIGEKFIVSKDNLKKTYSKEASNALTVALNGPVRKLIDDSTFSEDLKIKIFNALLTSRHPNLQYEVAEQIAMGAGVIAATLPQRKELKDTVNRLYQYLDNGSRFEPSKFR